MNQKTLLLVAKCFSFAAIFAHAPTTHAQSFTMWADTRNGLTAGTYPVLAIAPAPRGDIYYSTLLGGNSGSMGTVWRAKLNDPARAFTRMPGFPLPTPAAGSSFVNVFTMTTNQNGEPIVGLSANGRSDNVDPLIMTWDAAAGRWFAPPITPAGSGCAHNLYRVDRGPNGDIWAICQWHGAYRSADAGRSFQYVDVSALLHITHPGYFPTRAAGVNDLGALYSLGFNSAGTVFIGTETGGMVYSPDNGATWHPVDYQSTDPMSSMARVTNEGNVYGIGVALDGRLVMQGTPGTAPNPAADPTRLYAIDPVLHTVTLAKGIPDYWLGGRLQIVTLPSGAMFLHSNHDTVGTMTGTPQLGGILTSQNGIDWTAMNLGINETSMIPNTTQWIDANGRGATGGFAVDGTDLYTATTNGKIFRLSTGPASAVDAGTGSDGGTGSGGGSGSSATGCSCRMGSGSRSPTGEVPLAWALIAAILALYRRLRPAPFFPPKSLLEDQVGQPDPQSSQ